MTTLTTIFTIFGAATLTKGIMFVIDQLER